MHFQLTIFSTSYGLIRAWSHQKSRKTCTWKDRAKRWTKSAFQGRHSGMFKSPEDRRTWAGAGPGSRGKVWEVGWKEGHASLKGSSKHKADKVNFGLLCKISWRLLSKRMTCWNWCIRKISLSGFQRASISWCFWGVCRHWEYKSGEDSAAREEPTEGNTERVE